MEWDIYHTDHHPLSDAQLDAVEALIGYKLPADYRACVKINHTGQPRHDGLEVAVGDSPWKIGFGELLTPDPLYSQSNLLETLRTFRQIEGATNTIVPIVLGGGGDYLCLDYTNSATAPGIVFHFHELNWEDALFPVADSFTALLEMLKTTTAEQAEEPDAG